jgi:hypothetical protein
MALERGNLIKWVCAHHTYQANGDILVGLDPIYKYGIVMKVSEKSPSHFLVIDCVDARWHILDTTYDKYEILSEG